MSRIGRMPITVPAGVDFKLDEATNTVMVKGAKGTLTQKMPETMKIIVDGGTIKVERPNDNKENRALHGLTRTLVNNMVVGVSAGFKKDLEVNGVGYRIQMQGNQLVMNIGFSHQVTYDAPENIKIEVVQPNKIIVSGCDKQIVGQVAAEIRAKRPPEPYQGKGIKYATETIRRKEGKAGKAKK